MFTNGCASRLRNLSKRGLANLQRSSLYRNIVRSEHPRVIITEASEEDLAKVRQCFNLTIEAPSSQDGNAVNFVAKKRGKILGVAQLVRLSDGDTLDSGYYLFSLNVRRLYRGLGIGEGLTQEVVAKAKSEGVAELSVLTMEDNRVALGLFHKLGFRIRSPKEFKEGSPLRDGRKLILVKRLVQ